MTVAFSALGNCRICPQQCGADRFQGPGACGADVRVKVNLAQLHHGEEPVLSGNRGSGTIFFSHCNLHCVFCQNHRISQTGWGEYVKEEQCAALMLRLQEAGAHNVNLVSPTHYSLQVAESCRIARVSGLSIPIIWNSNAYEKVETLILLKGLVDIYLPDFKYAHALYGLKYSSAAAYPETALAALCEMQEQVGELQIDAAGIARKGLLVRHLVLPNRLSGTRQALYLLHERLGPKVSLSLMAQYYPAWHAAEYPELNSGLSSAEYQEALETAASLGFAHVFTQKPACDPDWTPEFNRKFKPGDRTEHHFHGKRHHV